MNLSKLTKANLILQLEQRSLATDGLKDELVKRLKEAIEKESVVEIDNQEENYDSEDEDIQNYENKADNDDKVENPSIVQESSDAYIEVNETLNDDEIVKDGDSTTVLTVEDAINMKSTNAPESCSMIVNVDDDDTAVSISAKDDNMDYDQSVGNRDTDNGDHEVIEISEEVVIDDEDNQDNDNNFNDQSFHNDQTQEDKDELENGESRDNESGEEEEKVNLWVHNVSEDVKALELKELFSKYGKVVSAKVVTNSKTATGNCFGCIQLSNEEDAQNCIKNLDKTEFQGQTIVVSKELNDFAPKEKIQRMVSPISSSGSWGGGKNRSASVKSLSPFVGEIPKSDTAKDDTNKNDKQEERSNYRPPYRGGRGGYRGGNSGGQSGSYAPRNYNRYDGQDNRGQSRQDYPRPTGVGDRRGGYGSSRQERDSGDSRPPYRSGGGYEGRPRDAYVPREDHGAKYEGGRYGQGGRDRYEYAQGGPDKASRGRRYYEEDGSRSSGRYEQDFDDRRSSYRPRAAPTDRDRDYVTSRREEVPFKRPRADHGDDRDPYSAAAPKKARGGRDEYDAPRLDRYHSPPPPAAKRSFYNERPYQAPSRPDYRDRDSGSRREAYPPPSRPSTRDYGSRPAYTAYSPPDERRTGGRPHGYSSSKPYSSAADFGGRSRNYEH